MISLTIIRFSVSFSKRDLYREKMYRNKQTDIGPNKACSSLTVKRNGGLSDLLCIA